MRKTFLSTLRRCGFTRTCPVIGINLQNSHPNASTFAKALASTQEPVFRVYPSSVYGRLCGTSSTSPWTLSAS
jgi:hypothetical protein